LTVVVTPFSTTNWCDPIELVGLARRKAQRHKRLRGRTLGSAMRPRA
jgi:hypothetical protein